MGAATARAVDGEPKEGEEEEEEAAESTSCASSSSAANELVVATSGADRTATEEDPEREAPMAA